MIEALRLADDAAHLAAWLRRRSYDGIALSVDGYAEELRRLHAVEQERDALKAEVEGLRRWKSTHAPRIEALEGLLAHYQTQAATGEEAAASLESERKANAILTDELEKLRADAGRYRWLRDVSVPPHNFYLSVPVEFHGVRYAAAEVDTAIDAAIKGATS